MRNKSRQVVRFPEQPTTRDLLRRAAKAAKTDETIAHAFKWWLDKAAQHGAKPGGEWMRENPPPTTLEEAEEHLERYHRMCDEAFAGVMDVEAELERKKDELLAGIGDE